MPSKLIEPPSPQLIMVLKYKVFFSKRQGVNRTVPAGQDDLKWVPTSSTLIYGEKDAVLVDTQLTIPAINELVAWTVASGLNVTWIYITHPHGDHFFGNTAILEQFPNAKVVAVSEVAAGMLREASAERQKMWKDLFPGQIPTKITTDRTVVRNEFELEGEKLMVVRTGHTDTDNTTTLWVPSIGLAVVGDAVYNNTHPFLGDSPTKESRQEWIAALEKIASLNPKVVISGHGDPSKGFTPQAISDTKAYLEDFERVHEETKTPEELYHEMLKLYPGRLNPGSLWGGSNLVKNKDKAY